jgi:hypothetical protein
MRSGSQAERASLGRATLFEAYALRERLVATMERENGVAEVYRQGLGAIGVAAVGRDIRTLSLFVSAGWGSERLHAKVDGILRSRWPSALALTLRVTFPRAFGWESVQASEGALLRLCHEGLLSGVDISGLDESSSTQESLELINQVCRLRKRVEALTGVRLSVSAHWGESIALDGIVATWRMPEVMRSMGVDSIGHGFLAFAPSAMDPTVQAPPDRNMLRGFTLEHCSNVSHLYGVQPGWDSRRLIEHTGASRVVFGSDSPDIVPMV